jgi:hypothetical protein
MMSGTGAVKMLLSGAVTCDALRFEASRNCGGLALSEMSDDY